MGSPAFAYGTPRFASTFVVISALLLSLLASRSGSAAIITLTDNNSVAQIDTDSSAGMFNWLIQGKDVLAQQWFWYRVGAAGPEAPINTISPSTVVTPNARSLTSTYSNANITVRVDYLLSGGAVVGPGQTAVSDIGETITITNPLNIPLDLHFFQYSDFDLTGTDTVQLGTNLGGLYNEALQTGSGGTAISETVASPGASHGEAALFPFTLNRLNDGLPTTLNDSAGPVGPGDATWALQWDFNIAPGASAIISKDKNVHLTIVPEPSMLAMLVPCLVGFAARRRKSL